VQLYGCSRTRADRVRWTLEEVGADYEYVPVELRKGETRTPEFLARNPFGKLPVLEVDQHYLTESAAICRFIADRHPAAGLIAAPGTLERARCDQWCDFAISELEQPLWLMAKHRFALPPEQRVAAVLETAVWEFERAVDILARGLGSKPWILGERFSVADILIGHTLAWARSSNQSLGVEAVVAYADRVLGRPAFQRVTAPGGAVAAP